MLGMKDLVQAKDAVLAAAGDTQRAVTVIGIAAAAALLLAAAALLIALRRSAA